MPELLWILAVALLAGGLTAVALRGRGRAPDLADLRELAVRCRGAAKDLPSLGAGEVAWPVAEKQIESTAEFAAFVMMYTHHEGPIVDRKDAYRRGIAATLIWHGHDPEQPPTATLHNILYKEGFAEDDHGDP
jgi:hypothetical protein